MQSNKIILSLLFVCFTMFAFGQLKGKSKRLLGTWVYEQGSGYEVWNLENGNLVGAGYRTNKLGDSVRVETLNITFANKYLYYTLETGQYTYARFTTTSKRQFISNKRKLDFISTENMTPYRMKYSFGFFNKKKMIISIYLHESEKKTKLILRKGADL